MGGDTATQDVIASSAGDSGNLMKGADASMTWIGNRVPVHPFEDVYPDKYVVKWGV